MDNPTIDQADLSSLTDKDKQELRQFIQNEQQRTRIQARMQPLSLFLDFHLPAHVCARALLSG